MAYRSINDLKAALLDALTEATDCMAEMIQDEVDEAVRRYYLSYSPTQYKRTGTLSDAPQRLPAVQTADGAEACVYLDTGLQYHTGTWNMNNVIKAAELYTHGGVHKNGVSIWNEPMQEVAGKSRLMWKKALNDAGLSVK